MGISSNSETKYFRIEVTVSKVTYSISVLLETGKSEGSRDNLGNKVKI